MGGPNHNLCVNILRVHKGFSSFLLLQVSGLYWDHIVAHRLSISEPHISAGNLKQKLHALHVARVGGYSWPQTWQTNKMYFKLEVSYGV